MENLFQPVTKETYIAMLQTGRYYEGWIEDGGYADNIVINAKADHFEYPNHKIPIQRGHSCFHVKPVQVCLLSIPPIKTLQPLKPDIEDINRHLKSLKAHIFETQKYEKMNNIIENYKLLEIECQELKRQKTEKNKGFTKRAKKRVNELLKETENILKSNAIKMKELDIKRKAETDATKKTQYVKDIDNLIKVNEELREMIKELNELAISTQVIDIMDEDSEISEEVNSGSHGFENNAVVIKVKRQIQEEMSLLAHELKHAYQFETSKLSVVPKGKGHFFLYDKHDEVEAYQRGAAFGGPIYEKIDRLPSIYNNHPNEYYDKYTHDWTKSILGLPDREERFQRIADKWNAVFRIDGRTYIPQSK